MMKHLSDWERRYFDMALTRKQRGLAKRLSHIHRDERIYDDELSELDNRNSSAAFVVLAMADAIAREEDSL